MEHHSLAETSCDATNRELVYANLLELNAQICELEKGQPTDYEAYQNAEAELQRTVAETAEIVKELIAVTKEANDKQQDAELSRIRGETVKAALLDLKQQYSDAVKIAKELKQEERALLDELIANAEPVLSSHGAHVLLEPLGFESFMEKETLVLKRELKAKLKEIGLSYEEFKCIKILRRLNNGLPKLQKDLEDAKAAGQESRKRLRQLRQQKVDFKTLILQNSEYIQAMLQVNRYKNHRSYEVLYRRKERQLVELRGRKLRFRSGDDDVKAIERMLALEASGSSQQRSASIPPSSANSHSNQANRGRR